MILQLECFDLTTGVLGSYNWGVLILQLGCFDLATGVFGSYNWGVWILQLGCLDLGTGVFCIFQLQLGCFDLATGVAFGLQLITLVQSLHSETSILTVHAIL